MIFTETSLAGAFIVDCTPINDDRGFFSRSFCQHEFIYSSSGSTGMTQMMDSELRGLVRSYFQGEMDYEQYRSRRTQVIDALTDPDKTQTASTNRVPRVRSPVSVVPEARMDGDIIELLDNASYARTRSSPTPSAQAEPTANASPEKGQGMRLIGWVVVGLVVIILLIGAVLLG